MEKEGNEQIDLNPYAVKISKKDIMVNLIKFTKPIPYERISFSYNATAFVGLDFAWGLM